MSLFFVLAYGDDDGVASFSSSFFHLYYFYAVLSKRKDRYRVHCSIFVLPFVLASIFPGLA